MVEACRRKNPVYETMTRWTGYGWTVRVWQDSPYLRFSPDYGIIYHLDLARDSEDVLRIVGNLHEQFPNIAAIEALDARGNGGLFYPDWK